VLVGDAVGIVVMGTPLLLVSVGLNVLAAVGATVGDKLGCEVFSTDGAAEGAIVGQTLDANDGDDDGAAAATEALEGSAVGELLGFLDGPSECGTEGGLLGTWDGALLRMPVGTGDGSMLGLKLGVTDGETLGTSSVIMRTTLLPLSGTKSRPSSSTLSCVTPLKQAEVAGPRSPQYPATPAIEVESATISTQ
jgi:hypothetical protein